MRYSKRTKMTHMFLPVCIYILAVVFIVLLRPSFSTLNDPSTWSIPLEKKTDNKQLKIDTQIPIENSGYIKGKIVSPENIILIRKDRKSALVPLATEGPKRQVGSINDLTFAGLSDETKVAQRDITNQSFLRFNQKAGQFHDSSMFLGNSDFWSVLEIKHVLLAFGLIGYFSIRRKGDT
ncbi:MAG: hypothetical protein KJ737_22255 [Proteobacteria bacterium]|nr:hypothetical protein [Pseudomonadota bacterium]